MAGPGPPAGSELAAEAAGKYPIRRGWVGGMLYVLPSLAWPRRDCHGHCHVKSGLIGGEGLLGGGGIQGVGEGCGTRPRFPPWLLGRAGAASTPLPAGGGGGEEDPRVPLGAQRPEQSRPVSWTGLGRHPPPPHLTLFLPTSSPVPTRMQKNGAGGGRADDPEPAPGHAETMRVCIADRNHHREEISPPPPRKSVQTGGRGGEHDTRTRDTRSPTEVSVLRGRGLAESQAACPAASPRLRQAGLFCRGREKWHFAFFKPLSSAI